MRRCRCDCRSDSSSAPATSSRWSRRACTDRAAHDAAYLDLPSLPITVDREYALAWPGARTDRFLDAEMGARLRSTSCTCRPISGAPSSATATPRAAVCPSCTPCTIASTWASKRPPLPGLGAARAERLGAARAAAAVAAGGGRRAAGGRRLGVPSPLAAPVPRGDRSLGSLRASSRATRCRRRGRRDLERHRRRRARRRPRGRTPSVARVVRASSGSAA